MSIPEIIKWTEIRGNPYNVKLSPQMLNKNGMAKRMVVIKKGSKIPEEQRLMNAPGSGARSYPKTDCAVIFDKDFVESKIKTQILEPLGIGSLKELIDVLDNQN
ncbi:MAG: hypothetical protein ACRC80_08585 [Waterburya sp.]